MQIRSPLLEQGYSSSLAPMFIRKRILNITLAIGISLACVGIVMSKSVAADDGAFSLQVSPSPLVTTLKPGQTTSVELKIRNTGTKAETLKIDMQSFVINNNMGEIKFEDKRPAVADWTSFSAPTFTVLPGQVYSEKVTFTTPQDAGFSYSFAFVVNRQDESQTAVSGGQLKGSVAIFSLINIDRPDAVRQLEIESVSADESMYEYLPATLSIKFKNTGNTIVQPAGDVFIQSGSDDKDPLAVLPVNQNSGYILPGSVRTLSVKWEDESQGPRIRIGRYTAKVVAVYNDGMRDVPIVREVSFWVFPWKLMLGLVVTLLLIGIGLWTVMRKATRLAKGKKRIRF